MPKTRKRTLLSLMKGLLIAVALTLVCMLAMAAALVYLQMSDRLLTVLNQLVKLLAIALGTCAAVPRGGSRGFLTGVEIALLYMALGYAMYVLLGSAVGAVIGAVRANLSPRRSRIKA